MDSHLQDARLLASKDTARSRGIDVDTSSSSSSLFEETDHAYSDSSVVSKSSSETNSDLEKLRNTLRVMWSEILNEDFNDINDQDSFFDLGGDSLSATELIILAKERGITLSMEHVFKFPTLHSMALKVTALVISYELEIPPFSLLLAQFSDKKALYGIQRRIAERCTVEMDDIEDIYPCTPLQEAMMASSYGGGVGYMTQLVYCLDKDVDLEQFQWTWRRVMSSNPLLRTRIVRETLAGSLQCVISEACEFVKTSSLSDYLESDSIALMDEGDPLFRLAIIIEPAPVMKRYFVLTLHHAIFDAASLSMTLHDAARIYVGDSNFQTRPLFKTYIKYIQDMNFDTADKYWAQQMEDVNSSPFPSLPDKDFKPMSTASLIRNEEFTWENKFGLTRSLIIRAAWAILMSFRTATMDVTFAVTQSGRSASVAGISTIAGPAITAIPLRVMVKPGATVQAFLQQIRQQASDMIPFEQYGSLNVRRRLGKDGLRGCNNQNLLLVQPAGNDENMKGLGLTLIEHLGMQLLYEFPLVNECTLTAQGYIMNMRYDDRVLSEPSVRILASQFNEILNQLCGSDEGTLLSSIRCATTEDYEQIRMWNRTAPVAVQNTAHEMFEQQSKRTPLAQALCAWDGNMSFDELDATTTILANHLINLGIGPEVLVPICFEKSIWTIVAILAILKSGGAWIPLDPKHPAARTIEVIKKSKATIIVSSISQAQCMARLAKQVVVPEDYIAHQARSTTQEVLKFNGASPQNTAYVLFTSGSTGTPKGVVISHAALCTGIEKQGQALGCNSSWRSLQFSAHTFDPSISESLMTLCHGGCVCIPSDEQRLNDLSGAIQVLGVNCAQLTPSIAHVMLPEDVPSLKTLIFVGEASSFENIARWADRVKLLNAYGPTETCIYCSVKTDISPNTSPSAIGTACGGTNWIVEPENHERLAAVGCVGEIAISGPSLGKGYLDNETETSAAFVTCSWLRNLQPELYSDRIYLTGDLAYYNMDGSMQLVGRKDNQVKLRGNRIELGDIEQRVTKLVPNATVLATVPTLGPCKRQLVILLCFNDLQFSTQKTDPIRLASNFESYNARLLLEDIQLRLAREVPGYMIPTYWLILERFPLNNSGKLDRKAVCGWMNFLDSKSYDSVVNVMTGDEHVAQKTIYEESPLFYELRKVWSTVLQVDGGRISPKTSFFALGGDSISAIKIVAQCKAKDLTLTVQDVFQCATIGRLAQVVRVTQNIGKQSNLISNSTSSFKLSNFQERQMNLDEQSPQSQSYHQCLLCQLLIDVPQQVLKSAIDKVVEKHSMLRTRFIKGPDGWEQYTATSRSYRLNFTQYEYINGADVTKIMEDGYTSIDLINGPVFSVDVYRTSAGSKMYLVCHRLVIDKRSWQVILRDMEELIKSRGTLPMPSSNFREWISLQTLKQPQHMPSGRSCKSELEYWGLSGDGPTFAKVSTLDWRLDSKCTEELMKSGRTKFRMEIDDILLAGLMHSSSQVLKDRTQPTIWAKQDGRILVREQLDVLELAGQFTVLYPVTPTSKADDGLEQNIRELKHFRQNINGQKLNSTDNINGLFEVYFHYEHSFSENVHHGSTFAELSTDIPKGSIAGRNGLLEVSGKVQNGELTVTFSFDALMTHQDLIAQWGEQMMENLHAVARNVPKGLRTIPAVDFPLLARNGGAMPELTEEVFQKLTGYGISRVEDIYPCTPFQEDILAWQSVDPSAFMLQVTMEISSTAERSVNIHQLEMAWRAVVRRHSILRTFFSHLQQDRAPAQIVLWTTAAPVEIVQSWDTAVSQKINIQESIPLHHMTLCQTPSGSVKCLLRISHALTDGWSLRILQKDLQNAYLGKVVADYSSASFRTFIANSTLSQEHLDYWTGRLDTRDQCILLSRSAPGSSDDFSSTIIHKELPTLPKDHFFGTSRDYGLTIATIIDTVWALTLRAFTGTSSITFGYVVHGRYPSIPRINEIMGPVLNMLVHTIDVNEKVTTEPMAELLDLAKELQASRLEGLAYSKCSPSGIHLKRGSETLFNTAVNLQMDRWSEDAASDLKITFLGLEDPWNVDIMVRIWLEGSSMRSRLEYRASKFSVRDIEDIARMFEANLQLFTSGKVESC